MPPPNPRGKIRQVTSLDWPWALEAHGSGYTLQRGCLAGWLGPGPQLLRTSVFRKQAIMTGRSAVRMSIVCIVFEQWY